MAQAAGFSFNSETVSGTTVRDLSGYFLHGQIVGSAAVATGKAGYGDALNCTGGALQVQAKADTYPVNNEGGLTVAAWVKLNDTTVAVRCAASGKGALSSGLDFGLFASNASGNVEFTIKATAYSTTTSIRDGAWHHVMAVLNRVDGPGLETVRIAIDGVQVQQWTGLTTGFSYSGNVTVEVGRNVHTGTDALNGLVDDFRWWNDPVSSVSWTSIRDSEMVDLQWSIYAFDGDTSDLGIYNRDLTLSGSGSFEFGLYGNCLRSSSGGAGASGVVNFGDMDRLALTGYIRLDAAPVGSAAPIIAIQDTGGTYKFRGVVNTDRTVTLTWITIYGTFAVTSSTALTVGTWTRYHFNMNPTYVGIRLGSDSQATTSTGNSNPHLSPTVNDLRTLYVGGDASSGGQVSFDYVNCTKNFIDVPKNNYWIGPANHTAVKPTNSARGVYEFNENSGTTANDQSASNNDLTLAAGATWIGTGVQGSALGEGTSTGPAAEKTGLTWSATPTGWSFAGWFKCRAASAGARIMVMRNGSSEVGHAFYFSGAFGVRLYGSGGNTGIVQPSGSSFPAETWTHLAASCNGSTIQFFKNGVHYGSADYTVGTLLSPTILRVGGDDSGEAVADVDSLQLFDTPLSRSSVQWLHENPGMFATGAPVAQSRVSTWHTKATTTQTRALSWDTRVIVAGARATTWNVLGALVAVTASRSTTWNVASSTTPVTGSRTTTWRVTALASDSLFTTWHVESDQLPPSGFTIKFPTFKVPLGREEPLRRMFHEIPKALVKNNGEWFEVAVPSQELLRVAEKYYLGGYVHELTAEEAADLPPQYVEEISA